MKKLCIIMAIAMLALLGGCVKKDVVPTTPDTTEPTQATSEAKQEGSTTAATEPVDTKAEPVPSIENLGDRPLGTAPTFGEDSEYAGHFIFKADQDVKNFRFFKAEMSFNDIDNILTGKSVKDYGSLKAIRAGEEVLLMGDTGETLPFLALSFESENGKTYYYAIEISGEDGHPLLTPFTYAEN